MSSLKWTISCCKHSVILSYFAAKVMIFIYFSMMSAAMYDYDKVANEQEKACSFLLYLPLSHAWNIFLKCLLRAWSSALIMHFWSIMNILSKKLKVSLIAERGFGRFWTISIFSTIFIKLINNNNNNRSIMRGDDQVLILLHPI